MRRVSGLLLLAVFVLGTVGCKKPLCDAPTVEAFNGRVVRDGEPVSFPEGEEVSLRLFSEKEK